MKRNIVVSLLLVLLLVFAVSCEEPAHVHTLEKVEAVAATCSSEGMSEYYQCSVCKQNFADKDAKTEVKDLATLKTAKDPASHSDVKKVDAVESTCTVNGTVEHWHCEGCGKNYSDETCKSELKTLEASLKAHETEMVKAAVAATCSEEGMKEYYQCSVCKLTFADKEAKTEVKDLATLKTAKDPANHSDVKKVDAVESTCTVNGTVEHWHCEGCGKNYSGEETCETELESLEAPLKSHTTAKIDAVAATCSSEGMKEYYKCSICEKTFEDAEAKKEIIDRDTLKTEKDPANHSEVKKVAAVESTCAVKGNIEHWHCEGCGKNYYEEECTHELDNVKTSLKPHVLGKVEAVAASCEKEGNVEHYHCSVCGGNFSDSEGNGKIETVVIPRHKEGDVVATGETFTVGEVEYSIFKCSHNNYFIDESCTEKLYKDYFDAAGLVVTEKDGVFNAVFVDGYMRLNHVGEKKVYGYGKVGVYFYGKEGKFYYSRVGLNESGDGDTSAFDYTANKELSVNIVKNEDGTLSISATATRPPFEKITSISINPTPNKDKSDIIMMTTTGGEQWTGFRYYENPLAGSWQDLDGYVLAISDLNGDKNIQYNLDGTDYYAFPLIDSPGNNQGTLFVAWDGDGARKIFHRNRWLAASETDLYIKWSSGALRNDLNGFTLYHPVSAE